MRLFFCLCIVVIFIISCHYVAGVGSKSNTPKEYLNQVIVNQDIYSKDSLVIISKLHEYLKFHQQSFHSKTYFDSTYLLLDTILYNNALNKVAVFVITKNPTSRQLAPKENSDYYYDAFCYLGKRSKDGDSMELRWQKSFYPINWYKESEISSLIREMYFSEFATIKDTNGLPVYKCNLNDKRFWDLSLWTELFPQDK